MNYIFFGTPRFAKIVLERLIDANLIPTAIVCNPDRMVGRKKILTAPLTKQLVTKRSVQTTILQPEKLDEAFIKTIRDLQPDFFVVAAYAKIIPQEVLNIPRFGALGTHPSLLPKYRGASPIQSAILGGETETGATIYQMDAKMDHGPIIAQSEWPIAENEQYLQLEEELALLSGSLLMKAIPSFTEGKVNPAPQNETEATYTKKFETQNGFVEEKDLEAATTGNLKKAEAIMRKINAFNPEPGCWTIKNEKRMKLLEAEIKDGLLRLQRVQDEGGKPRKI